MEKQSFNFAFVVKARVIFEVRYYRCGNNANKHFSTLCNLLDRTRTDYECGGQAQEDLLPKNTKAYKFYKKWDVLHTEDLTTEQYSELLVDIEVLKGMYPFISNETDNYISFDKIVRLDREAANVNK